MRKMIKTALLALSFGLFALPVASAWDSRQRPEGKVTSRRQQKRSQRNKKMKLKSGDLSPLFHSWNSDLNLITKTKLGFCIF